ncbi:MAG TPA: bifunctional oligoribonuclease/PAP phosphatase NrnA [Acidimicrobiia bacterium]|jgi:phosphoesterase RecJ-like protein
MNVLTAAAELVEKANELALACHVGPDGDALGSMLGFAASAQLAGKKVVASFGSPFDVPVSYRHLPIDLLSDPAGFPKEPGTMVTFDAASLDRLGELAKPAANAQQLLVIDHHVTTVGFGHVNVIDPKVSATGELVYQLIVTLGWPIDARVATSLHTALVTDTGRFQYSNTSPQTLHIAARLVELGARPEVAGQNIYEETSFGYLKVAAAVLGRAELDADRKLVWSELRQADLTAAGANPGEVDQLIDLVRLPGEAEVAVLIKEAENATVKVSLRSRGTIDVGSIAQGLSGGGHHNAAGFTHHGTAEEAIDLIRKALDG